MTTRLPVINNIALGVGDAIVYAWVIHSLKAAGFDTKIAPNRNWDVFDMMGVTADMHGPVPKNVNYAPAKGIPGSTNWVQEWIRGFGYPDVPVVRPPYVERPEEREWAEGFWHARDDATGSGPRVVIFPHSLHKNRQWPECHSVKLAKWLFADGCNVVAAFWPWKAPHPYPYAIACDLRKVFAMVKRADLVVSSDSGPGHIGGTLDVTTVTINGPTVPSATFGQYPSVIGLAADKKDAPCVGCYWKAGSGYGQECDIECSALATVQPWHVRGMIVKMMQERRPGWGPAPRIAGLEPGTYIGNDFRLALARSVIDNRIMNVVETGTYDGRGSTATLEKAASEIGGMIHSIECNKEHHDCAVLNLAGRAHVKLYLGMSLRRDELPDIETIRKDCEKARMEGVAVDSNELEGLALFYAQEPRETEENDLLRRLILQYDPGLIMLDSAGHLGYREWKAVEPLLKVGKLIAMDDVRHIKHYRTLRDIEASGRFERVFLGRERHWSAIYLCRKPYDPSHAQV